MGEALDGETLMLGPVPAWRLPVHQGAPAPGIDAPRTARGDEVCVRRVGAPSAARARGEVVAALFPRAGHRPTREDDPARAEDGPPEAAGAEPARFGWFRAAR